MPNTDILAFLFATVATIVATVTGLIGAFSTFRLQNIDAELNFLKGLVINKKFGTSASVSINDFLKGEQYYLLEKIYDTNMEGVALLEKTVRDHQLHLQCDELLLDIDNIRRNQVLHHDMKALTLKGFISALAFVFVSLILLILTNELVQIGSWLWLFLLVYLLAVAYIFIQFVRQVKQLMF